MDDGKHREQITLDVQFAIDERFTQGSLGRVFHQCVPGGGELNTSVHSGGRDFRGGPGPTVSAANGKGSFVEFAEQVVEYLSAAVMVLRGRHGLSTSRVRVILGIVYYER